MAIKIDITDGAPAIIVQKGALKVKNEDTVDYNIDVNPRDFTKITLPEPVKAGKSVTIPANGSKKSGVFELSVSEINSPEKESKKSKKPKEDLVKPRMIIKVE